MAGLVCADLCIRFIPTMPLFHFLKKPGFLAMGMDTEYGLALNRPGFESFFFHVVKLRLPVEAFLELSGGHHVGLGLGPLLEIDTMLQSRLYGSTVTETTITPGVSFSILYNYAFSASVSLGISNILDVAFYAQPLVTYSPRVFVDLRLGGSSEEQKK